MLKTLTIAAAALLTAGAAHAETPAANTVKATYNSQTQRFCVQPGVRNYGDQVHPPIFHRTCMTQKQWRSRGIDFEAPRQQLAAK